MRRISASSILLLLSMAALIPAAFAEPKKGYNTITEGEIYYSSGHYLEGQAVPTGFDPYGYNYQAHLFNGSYANAYLGRDGYPPYEGDDEAYHQRLIEEGFLPTEKSYGDVTRSGGFQAGNFPEVWDLTSCDVVISFTYDANGLVDDYGGGAHAWSEIGIRTVGYGNFNPTWDVEGAGVWLATDYDWAVNTFDPDPSGSPTLDLDDKLILQKAGGQGEGDYNLPASPPNPWANHRVWFDRDGVDQWQAQNPLAVDGGTYNTGGAYEVVITIQAIDETTGIAFMTINGLDQGFETDGNWNTMELTPAGMTFTGDMTNMQVFYGLYGYGATHTVEFRDIKVHGCLSGRGNGKGDPYDEWYWPYREVRLTMKWNDAWLSNVDRDNDGQLDRYWGFDSYIGSGAWETNHMWGTYEEDGNEYSWDYFVKIVAAPEDANLMEGIWYEADETEIGPVEWGSFAVIQRIYNDEGTGEHGVEYLSPASAGFGHYK